MSLLTLVKSKVKDTETRLADDLDYAPAIDGALQRYSRHHPRLLVADLAGNGTHDLTLPATWLDEFSTIKTVEYPLAEIPASEVDPAEHSLYQSPTGLALRLLELTPAEGESVRVTFTAPRLEAQVPSNDLDAVACLAASFCCEALANLYTQTSDPLMSADVVNYRSKGYEFAARAKRLRELYYLHVAVDDEDGPPAALVVAAPPAPGRGRLTH